ARLASRAALLLSRAASSLQSLSVWAETGTQLESRTSCVPVSSPNIQPLGFQHFLGIVMAARVHLQAGGVVERARRLLRAGGSDRHESESGDMLECRCVGLPASRRADQSQPHGVSPSRAVRSGPRDKPVAGDAKAQRLVGPFARVIDPDAR